MPLWASVLYPGGEEAVVWRPEASSVRAWREALIFLGRIPSTFQIRLHSLRSVGQRADVAIDQLEFLDCALPCKPLKRSHLSLPFVFYSQLIPVNRFISDSFLFSLDHQHQSPGESVQQGWWSVTTRPVWRSAISVMAAMTVVMDLMSSTAVRNLISPESHNKYVGIF